ncbi:MAG: ABC transporter permease [Lachnospiraceae bacterium]
MLIKKMTRDLWANKEQFLTIFIFSLLTMMAFMALKSESLGGYQALDTYNSETNRANGWLYGEGFSEENLAAVKKLDGVGDAQLRTSLTGKALHQNNAQVEVYLEDENIVSKPLVIEGDPVDFSDENSLWLDKRFADAWELHVGDSFTINYNGIEVTRDIAGLVESSEYLYYFADTDMDSDFKNIAYVFLSADAIPTFPKTELIFTTDRDVLEMESEISDAVEENYAVLVDQTKISGINSFYTELKQHEMLAYVFPLVFVVFSILLIMTTMRRIVNKQRTQIGTMNAIGVSQCKITLHYVAFSFFITFFGGLIGLFLGLLVIGQILVDLYLSYYVLPGWKAGLDASAWIVLTVLVIGSVLAAWLSTRKIMKIHPAEALRPAAPKAGKNSLFEKLPFWDGLGFNVQYNLRDISRFKLRTMMSFIGMTASMMLMVMALACGTMISETTSWYFDKICNYSAQAVLADGITLDEADSTAEKYAGELLMMSEVEVAKKRKALASDRTEVIFTATENKGYYGITDTDFELVEIPEDTIAITKKTAEELGVNVGDTVYWHFYTKNEWYESKIGLINRNPTVSGITVYRDYLESLDAGFEPVQLLTDQSDIKTDNDILVVNTKEEIEESFNNTFLPMSAIVYLLSVFSMIFAVVVLYNSGSISFEERRREFGTLKVIGFATEQIRRLMTTQNIWVTICGILIGAPLGPVLLQWMLSSDGSAIDFNVFIEAKDFVKAGLFILCVSLLVGFLFSKRIRRLDMVESMKAGE